MSNTKKIVVNMDLLKPPGSKTRKKQSKPLVPVVSPNKLKTELINKIRHKNTSLSNTNTNKSDSDKEAFSDEFCKSIEYLNNIKKTKQEKAKTEQNKTEKQRSLPKQMISSNSLGPKLVDSSFIHNKTAKNPASYQNVQIDLPDELLEMPKIEEMTMTKLNIPESVPIKISKVETIEPDPDSEVEKELVLQSMLNNSQINYKVDSEVEHGCLKNGLKPCYRKWKQNQTRKNVGFSNQEESSPIQTVVQETIKELFVPSQESQSEPQQIVPKNIIKTTTTKKYELGKSSKYRKVGVLIKNKNTRKNIIQAYNKLKKTPIHEIKKQLKKQGLIKVGTTAPADMLRQTFESSILAGEVNNKNDEILFHNFMNEKEEK